MESDVDHPAAGLNKTDVLHTIYGYLRDRFPALADVEATTPLLQGGAIDSLGFLELMTFLSERFGITLEDEDFDACNLETAGKLADFVERKL
jgi:acyl carrier protein